MRRLRARAGTDLGLNSLSTLSDEPKIEIPQFYPVSELKLVHPPTSTTDAEAHARNSREDCQEYGFVVVGDVRLSMARTNMAKLPDLPTMRNHYWT